MFNSYMACNQVGIIGRTGAGKSSVLNALFRLTPLCSGSISVDGMDVKNIPVRELRAHLAIVPQSPFLFEGSLRYSIRMFLQLMLLIVPFQL